VVHIRDKEECRGNHEVIHLKTTLDDNGVVLVMSKQAFRLTRNAFNKFLQNLMPSDQTMAKATNLIFVVGM